VKSTKRQNCPVTLYAVLDEKAEAWVVQSSKNQHNHELLSQSQSVADAIYWKHGTVYTKDIVNKRGRIKNALNKGSNCDTTMQLMQMLEERQSQALRKAVNIVFSEAKKMVCIWHMLVQNLRTACRKFFDNKDDYNKLLLLIQKVAYAEEMSIVEKAFDKVKEATMKSRDPNYILAYFEE
ncbi:10116_t:CDS:2, partial [Dentiscutata heterogama]